MHTFKESPKQLKYIQVIVEAKDRMVEEHRFETWLRSNNIEHLKTTFRKNNIITLYDVRDHLEQLKTSDFLDAFHALGVLEMNRDSSLEEYEIFYHRSVLLKLFFAVLSVLWLLGKKYIFFVRIFMCAR